MDLLENLEVLLHTLRTHVLIKKSFNQKNDADDHLLIGRTILAVHILLALNTTS